MLLAGAAIVHAQGQVSFANYFSSGNYVTVEYGGHAVGGTGTSGTTDGADWTVELYGAAGSSVALASLVPAVLAGTTSTAVTATLAGVGGAYLGQWNSGAIGDITGTVPGGPATVAVAAWYNNGGTITSITAAQNASPAFANGFSATGNVTTGGAPNLPAALPVLGNGIISTVGNVGTPEPSTIALGVMGASAFLMRLRKK